MLATGLVFAFGALVATLLALLLTPLVWRQAQRLARRDFLATMPTSLNEIRAEVDRVRAESAFAIRRQEMASFELREASAKERAESGRATMALAESQKTLKDLAGEMTLLEEEAADLATRLAASEAQAREIEGAHETIKRSHDLRGEELEALADRFREVDAVADERRLRLATAETQIENLQSEIRSLRRELVRVEEARTLAQDEATQLGGRLNHLEGVDPELPILLPAPADAAEPANTGAANGDARQIELDPETLRRHEALRARVASDTPPSTDEVRAHVLDVAAEVIVASGAAEARALDGEDTPSALVRRVRERLREPAPAAETAALTDAPAKRRNGKGRSRPRSPR